MSSQADAAAAARPDPAADGPPPTQAAPILPDAGLGAPVLSCEVETLPDGRRISYYALRTS